MFKCSTNMFLKNYRPLVMAHRGDSANIPENTAQSFEDARKLKVDVIETDVHITKDNKFVLFHDKSVERTTDGQGLIADLTLAQLKQLDAAYKFQTIGEIAYPFRGKGFRIHTLEEIIPLFPEVRFNIDIKDKSPHAPRLLAELLHDLNVEDRVIVGSFHPKQVYRFRKHSTATPTSAGPLEVLKFWWKSKRWVRKHRKAISEFPTDPVQHQKNQMMVFGKKLPYVALQIPESFSFLRLITPEFIRFAHEMGIAVHVWTINDPLEMQKFLRWNIDGIFTDTPAVLIDVVKKYQNPPET
ncbi:MAG: glycerophosphodiester phosphodiesterase [Promethearchaeota archaeon]